MILRVPEEACFCVSQVVARDDDQGANGQLSYMLSGENDNGAFSLSSSGQLSVTRTLDREAQAKYVLLITATDSGEAAAGGLERVAFRSVSGFAKIHFVIGRFKKNELKRIFSIN